jgi:protein-tyrosine-phosphatase
MKRLAGLFVVFVFVAFALQHVARASRLSAAAAADDPTVIFVCEHGAAKSVIATAYFNKMAAERGLRVRAEFRGVNPQAELSAGALKGLHDDGLSVPEGKPAAIAQADVEKAAVIFAIGCTLPSHATASGKADSWNDVPDDKGYAAMRDAIKGHVERLIDGLLQSASGQMPLALVATIELPGVEGRIDHLAVDAAAQRLYVAALGNNTVEVLDVRSNRHLKSLPGFREPQGVATLPDARLVAVANGQGEGLQFVDANDDHLTRTVRLGDDSDNVRYDPAATRLYVGFGSGALAAVNPADGKVLGQARLAGHPESFQLERSGSRAFVNVPAADHIAVVDRAAMHVVATWPVVGAKANFPMALDETHHRLFVGCRRPAKVLVYDTATGKETSAFDIVGDTDDLFYDAARQRLYVSGGEGYLDVFQEQDAGRFSRVAHIATAAGARTSLFVPDQSRLYLAVPHRGNQKAEVRIYAAR